MLKTKRGCGLWDFLYFRNRRMDYWRGVLDFVNFVVVCHIISKLFFSGRLLRNIRHSIVLLGFEDVSILATASLVSHDQLIYLTVHEGFFICILS
jgi:hypothetical protein